MKINTHSVTDNFLSIGRQGMNSCNERSQRIKLYKLLIFSVLTFTVIVIQTFNSFSQGVAINTDGSTADLSAILDIKSTTQGTLIPRMTLAQRALLIGSDGIAGNAPATGCLIYQTDNTPGYYYYNGTVWTPLFSGTSGWSLTGNSLSGTEFLGSTNAQPLIFKTNNAEWMRVLSTGTVGIGTTNPGAKFGVSGSDQYVAYFQGTQTATDGATQYSVVSGSTFSPSSSTTWVAPFLAYGNFQPGAGVTIANAAGMVIIEGAQGGAGTVTNGYGLYVDNPNFGTNKYAAYFGGKVGIGTLIPVYKLHVYNSDPALGINSYSQFSPVLTANLASNLHSQWNEINAGSAFNFNGSLYAAINRVNILAAQTGTISQAIGSANDIYNSGTGTITTANGSFNEVRNILTGNITNAYGSNNLVQNMSTGTIAIACGVISGIGNSGGGTITNGYGLYVGPIGATNKWSIYANDATAPSYFAGNVGIGTYTPSALLTVGANLGGTAASTTFKTNSLALGTTATNALTLASFGFTSSNATSLGIRAYRTINGTDWTTTAVGLVIDVDNTVGAGASLWLHANGYVGIGNNSPNATLDVKSGGVYALGVRNMSDIYTMVVLNSGQVGIATTTPGRTLSVNGSVGGVGAYWNDSDRRYKKNISKIENCLEKITLLEGVSYDWRKEEFPEINFDNTKQLGLIAQDVEKIIPEAVSVNKEGYYAMAYSTLIPVLIEAIKEQQQIINSQQLAIGTLQSVIAKQQTTNDKLKADIEKIFQQMGIEAKK